METINPQEDVRPHGFVESLVQEIHNMVTTSLCFGWWAECPQECSIYTPEKNQTKCFVWKLCYADWLKSGGKLGLYNLTHPEI